MGLAAGSDLGPEDIERSDQDYRAELDQAQKPSNIIMLRTLPPNATVNEVSTLKAWLSIPLWTVIYLIRDFFVC